jgi:microcystin-dependent protein
MPKTRRQFAGAGVASNLTGPIAASGVDTFGITASTNWSTSTTIPFYVVVSPQTSAEEKMLVTLSSNTVTIVSRGVDGTSGNSHASGATIYPVFTATDADEANELTSKYANRGSIVYQGSSTFQELVKGTQGHALVIGANDPAWGQLDTVGIKDDAVSLAKLADAVIDRLVPVGTIAMFAGGSAPTGWLLCNGTSTSGYPTLASIVGGTTPDFKGRVAIGAGTGSGLTARNVGDTGGNETHTLSIGEIPSHNHNGETSQNTASHSHAQLVGLVNYETGPYQAVVTVPIGSASGTDGNYSTGTQSSNHIHTIPSNGGGGAHNNMQPFRVVNYIIKHD